MVLRGGAAERAGFAPGDEWLGIEVAGSRSAGWRLRGLDDLTACANLAEPGKKIVALVSRDQRLLRLNLVMPAAFTTWRSMIRDPARLDQWLAA